MGVCLHVRARAHCLPLTTPPSTSAAAPPPPPHTIVSIDVCCMQCGGCAVCCEGRLAERAGSEPTGVNINCKHARQGPRSTAQPRPSCARHCHKNANTEQTRPQITHAGHRKGRSAAPGGWGHCSCVHCLPIRTTCWARGNCAVQPALPSAQMVLTSSLNRPHNTKHTLA